MGTDPNSPDNRWLLDAMQQTDPGHLFPWGLSTSLSAHHPHFIVGWHPERLRVELAFGAILGASAQAALPAAPERRYALREIKARLLRHPFGMPS
jgi:hypothetical protein